MITSTTKGLKLLVKIKPGNLTRIRTKVGNINLPEEGTSTKMFSHLPCNTSVNDDQIGVPFHTTL